MRKLIKGIVEDQNGHPIPDAEIFIVGRLDKIITNAIGQYSVLLRPIEQYKFSIVCRCPNYTDIQRTIDMYSSDEAVINFTMKAMSPENAILEYLQYEFAAMPDQAKMFVKELTTHKNLFLNPTDDINKYIGIFHQGKPQNIQNFNITMQLLRANSHIYKTIKEL